MADSKKFEIGNGVGDLSHILHNQGVSDLSWLAVDEEDYRAAEALPKQNLDIIPELQKALAFEEGDDVPHVIPLKPHTIVNRNPLDTPQASSVDMTNPIRNRVSSLVMEGMNPKSIGERILLEFSPADVRIAASAIKEVLSERGLLGNVYIDSEHFPRCAQQDPKDRKFVATHGKRALFVLAKSNCSDCVCNKNGVCSSFKKTIANDIPYGPKLAAHYAPQLSSEKRDIPISRIGSDLPNSSVGWKEVIKSSFLSKPISSNPDGIRTIQNLPKPAAAVPVTREQVAVFLSSQEDRKSEEKVSDNYIKFARRMMKGHDDRALLVASTDPEIRRLSSEYGLLGHTWLDMDALGGCKKTLEHIANVVNHGDITEGLNSVPDFIIRRSSTCSHCKGASDGACANLCRISTIVQSAPAYDKRNFAKALLRAVGQKRVDMGAAKVAVTNARVASDWKSLTVQANLFSMPTRTSSEYSGARVQAWAGSTGNELNKAEMNPEEVRRSISHLMNLGFSGKKLQASVLNRYSRDDLSQVPEVGSRLASEDGIQGHYYIDPTAYSDYGRGCEEGSKGFRKSKVANILASGGCNGCALQTHPGWCSKYAKSMIRQVPVEIRTAAAKARVSLPVIQQKFENPVEKYELANEMDVDLSGSKSRSIEIGLSSPNIDE